MKKTLAAGIGLVILLLAAGVFLFPEVFFDLAVKAERHSAGLVKKEIQVDDHKIVYLEGGSGQTVLLLHGFGGNKDNWPRFAKCLTGDYHVVIPDLPGFGESSRLQKASYDADSQLRRIDRFTGALNLEKFHLAGNSMGGLLAGLYSAKYPPKVTTLALLAPAGVRSPHLSELTLLIRKGTNPLLVNSLEDFDKLMDLCFVRTPFIPPPFRRVLAADAIKHHDFNEKIMKDMIRGPLTGTPSPLETFLEPYLPQIQAPALILWGDGDKILDVGGAAVLEKNLKNHTTVIIKNTGHIPMMEAPRETASYYIDFLRAQSKTP